MRSRTLAFATTAVVATLALAACGGSPGGASGGTTTAPGGDPVPGGVLVYATDVQPQVGGLDPYVASAFANENILVQIYGTLLRKDDNGTIEPSIAESWEQVNDTTYRFTLRDDAAFSNGTPVTTGDVIFSYETMKADGARQAPYLTTMESITALDDSTVEVKFSAPSGSFLNFAAAAGMSFIVNKAWYESTAPADREKSALGSGPFALDEWVDNVSISLVRNEHYWEEGKPYLDGVEFQIVADESTRLSLLQQGSADAAWIRDPQMAEQAASSGFNLGQNAATRNMAIFFNAESGHLANVEVRRALSVGIDRDSIIELATYGTGKKTLVVPIGDPEAIAPTDETPYFQYDPELARKLLAEAGYSDLTVNLTYASDASFALDVPMVEIMKEQLAEVGITLQLEALPWSEVVSNFFVGDWEDMILVPLTYQPDLSGYFNPLRPGQVTSKLGDQTDAMGELLAQLDTTSDPDARRGVLARLEHEVADKVLVLIPYTSAQRQELWAQDVHGYSADPYTYRMHLKDAWLSS